MYPHCAEYEPISRQFIVPANWNILIYSEDTQQLDVVEVSNIPGKEFTALINGPTLSRIKGARVTVTDYIPTYRNIVPLLGKNQLLCHPISPDLWVNIAPSDTYNKYLKDLMVGDIIL